jgi:hypothetical protein
MAEALTEMLGLFLCLKIYFKKMKIIGHSFF